MVVWRLDVSSLFSFSRRIGSRGTANKKFYADKSPVAGPKSAFGSAVGCAILLGVFEGMKTSKVISLF